MHTVVATVTVNDIDAAVKKLNEQIISVASSAPGFIGGYWVALPGDKSVGFDSEAQVQAAVEWTRPHRAMRQVAPDHNPRRSTPRVGVIETW